MKNPVVMKFKKGDWRKYAVAVLVAAFCIAVLAGGLLDVAPEVVSFDNIELAGGEDDSLFLVATLRISGNNRIDAVLRELNYTLVLHDSSMARGCWWGDREIRNNEVSNFDLEIGVGSDDVPNWIDAFAAEDSLSILVEGSARVEALFSEIPVSFSSMEKISVNGILEMMLIREAFRLGLRVTDIQMPSFSLSGTRMDADIEISNSYPFPFTLKSGILELFISGGMLGRILLEEGEQILPGETQHRTVRLSLNHGGPLLSLLRTALERSLSYEISGDISLMVGTVDFSVPLERQGVFSLHE